MNPTDQQIRALYSLSLSTDWQGMRERALLELRRLLGAEGAAWMTTGEGLSAGPYTESPDSGFHREGLLALRFSGPSPVLALPGPVPARVIRYAHAGSRLVSLLALRWPARAPVPEDIDLERLAGHLAEASVLAMQQFVQRDEWLRGMGRPNRGAAALTDARGLVYACSARFAELLAEDTARLPFGLPEALLDDGGAFTRDGLHLRVQPLEGLFLLHVRRPLPLDVLSPREQQIARALGAGKTFKTVARQCDIAVSTVANHATRIYRKLGVYRREELVELMRSAGIGPSAGAGKG